MTRRRVFADAADRIVRSALAVRPCLPITLPRSCSADLELEHQRVRLGDLLDLDLFRVVDEAPRQVVDQVAQRRLPGLGGSSALDDPLSAASLMRRSDDDVGTTLWRPRRRRDAAGEGARPPSGWAPHRS